MSDHVLIAFALCARCGVKRPVSQLEVRPRYPERHCRRLDHCDLLLQTTPPRPDEHRTKA